MKTKLGSIAFTQQKAIRIEYLFEINKRFCLTNMLGHSLIARSSAAIKIRAAIKGVSELNDRRLPSTRFTHGPFSHGVPKPCFTAETLQGTPYNLFIKTPKYAYQREYRIIWSQPVECRLLPDETNPGCKIEEYDHVELDLSSGLTGFFWKASVVSLEEARGGLMLKLPHRA